MTVSGFFGSPKFAARYNGWCENCGQEFYEGDIIRYDRNDDLVHDVCPDGASSGPVCPSCWTFHAGECL